MAGGDVRLLHDRGIGMWEQIPIEIMTFPGGEPHVKGEPRWGSSANLCVRVRCSSAQDFMTAMVVTDWAKRQGGYENLFLDIPYFPGARQDRGAPLTSKVYADIVNLQGYDEVYILEPHSDVLPALINNVKTRDVRALWNQISELRHLEDIVLVAPDVGATKRVEELAMYIGAERVVQGYKHRDMVTGKLSDFTVDLIPDPSTANVIIVDDICDGGGTFIPLADELERQGIPKERRFLWTTHGIFSKGVPMLKQAYGWVGCTDSFRHKSQLLGVNQVIEVIGD